MYRIPTPPDGPPPTAPPRPATSAHVLSELTSAPHANGAAPRRASATGAASARSKPAGPGAKGAKDLLKPPPRSVISR